MGRKIESSELILNKDGSVYHLNLLPEDVAPIIITVGDQNRVAKVSKYFDRVELRKEKREFTTHTGYIGDKRVTVISTGIGTDNIDIVINELDALFNIDLQSRKPKDDITRLNFIRIGTSGCLQADIPSDSILLSEHAFGIDGMLNFYDVPQNELESALLTEFDKQLNLVGRIGIQPTSTACSRALYDHFMEKGIYHGITASSTGFYGPQGRFLRLKPRIDLPEELAKFRWKDYRITNFEMETSAIYGMANMLGHRALSVNALIANRPAGTFSADPGEVVEKTIKWALGKLRSF